MVISMVAAYEVAAAVPDPELPMLTIDDLGILRSVAADAETGTLVVAITPTYSGCPAMAEIAACVRQRLLDAGYQDVRIRTELAPPWTSDWITEEGRRKLAEAGVAPPHSAAARPPHAAGRPVPVTIGRRAPAACPRCGSSATRLIAEFGATACKSLHACAECGEPFEAVKAI